MGSLKSAGKDAMVVEEYINFDYMLELDTYSSL